MMKRREFITLLGGAAAAWPLAARGAAGRADAAHRHAERSAADDPEAQARVAAFAQGLQQLGWTVGRNVQIDIRWAAGNVDDARNTRRNCRAPALELLCARRPGSVISLVWLEHERRCAVTGNSDTRASSCRRNRCSVALAWRDPVGSG